MARFICICLFVAGLIPLWGQVEPSAAGGAFTPDDDTRMLTPPPLSGESYPTAVSSEVRTNYVSAGMVFTAAYTDNLLNAESAGKTSDETYSILPTLALERATPRQAQSFRYGAGFTFYQHTSDLNAVTQDAEAEYRLHLSRYSTISFQDSFSQNSNSFNQTNPSAGGAISGSPQSPSTVLIVPFQDQMMNTVRGGIAYQFARDAMIGGGGNYQFLHYKNLASVPGLSDSDTGGASAFYSRRISRGQYLGGDYSYARFSTHPVNSTTSTNAILVFYSFYPRRSVSLSVLAGPQYFNAVQAPYPSTSAWTPVVLGSVGWQASHTNLTASYSRIVSGGSGLLGAYYANVATGSLRWLMSRSWNLGAEGGYSNLRNATPIYTTSNQGGHTWSGGVSLDNKFSEYLIGELGYSHFHQSYGAIQSVSNYPDSNRAYISINFQLTRPLGR